MMIIFIVKLILMQQDAENRKEEFDYYRNLIKGFTPQEASADYDHDRQVNKNSIHLSKNPLYGNAKEGCQRL